MVEIPQRIWDELSRIWFDFEHFEYVLLNGLLPLFLSLPLIVWVIKDIRRTRAEARENSSKEE